MPTNPDTSSEVEIEPDGDFAITFPMQLPTPPDSKDQG